MSNTTEDIPVEDDEDGEEYICMSFEDLEGFEILDELDMDDQSSDEEKDREEQNVTTRNTSLSENVTDSKTEADDRQKTDTKKSLPKPSFKSPAAPNATTQVKPAGARTTPVSTKTTPAATKTTPTATKSTPTATKTTPTATKTTPTATKTPPTATNTTSVATKTTPVATKTTPVATKTTPAAKIMPVASKTTPVASKTTHLASKTTPGATKTTHVATKTTHVATKTMPVAIKTTPEATKATSVATKTTSVATKTTPVATKKTPVATKKTPVATTTTPVAPKTTPVATCTKTTPVATNTTPVSTKATPVATTSVATKTTPVATKTTPVATKTTPVASKTTPVATKTTPVATKTTPVATKTTPVATKTTPVATKTTPVATKTTPVATKTTPVATKSTSVAIKTTPVATKATPVAIKTTPTLTKATPAGAKTTGKTGAKTVKRLVSANSKKPLPAKQTDPAVANTSPVVMVACPTSEQTQPTTTSSTSVGPNTTPKPTKVMLVATKTTPAVKTIPVTTNKPSATNEMQVTANSTLTAAKITPSPDTTKVTPTAIKAPVTTKATPTAAITTPVATKPTTTGIKAKPTDLKTIPVATKVIVTPAVTKTTPVVLKTPAATMTTVKATKTAPVATKATTTVTKNPVSTKSIPASSTTTPVATNTTSTVPKTTPVATKAPPTGTKTTPTPAKATPKVLKTTPTVVKATTPTATQLIPEAAKTSVVLKANPSTTLPTSVVVTTTTVADSVTASFSNVASVDTKTTSVADNATSLTTTALQNKSCTTVKGSSMTTTIAEAMTKRVTVSLRKLPPGALGGSFTVTNTSKLSETKLSPITTEKDSTPKDTTHVQTATPVVTEATPVNTAATSVTTATTQGTIAATSVITTETPVTTAAKPKSSPGVANTTLAAAKKTPATKPVPTSPVSETRKTGQSVTPGATPVVTKSVAVKKVVKPVTNINKVHARSQSTGDLSSSLNSTSLQKANSTLSVPGSASTKATPVKKSVPGKVNNPIKHTAVAGTIVKTVIQAQALSGKTSQPASTQQQTSQKPTPKAPGKPSPGMQKIVKTSPALKSPAKTVVTAMKATQHQSKETMTDSKVTVPATTQTPHQITKSEADSEASIRQKRVAEKQERQSINRLKTVMLHPVKVEDLADPVLQPFVLNCHCLSARFMGSKKGIQKKGHLEIRYFSEADANNYVGEMQFLKLTSGKYLSAKILGQCGPWDGTLDEWHRKTIVETEGLAEARCVYVHNLPAETTEGMLRILYPQVINVTLILPKEDDKQTTGNAVLEFLTPEEAEIVTEDSKNCQTKIGGNEITLTLIVKRSLKPQKPIPVTSQVHSSDTGEKKEKKAGIKRPAESFTAEKHVSPKKKAKSAKKRDGKLNLPADVYAKEIRYKGPDIKQFLLIWCQANDTMPRYEYKSWGPSHRPMFRCEVEVEGIDHIAKGTSTSKKNAQNKGPYYYVKYLIKEGKVLESSVRRCADELMATGLIPDARKSEQAKESKTEDHSPQSAEATGSLAKSADSDVKVHAGDGGKDGTDKDLELSRKSDRQNDSTDRPQMQSSYSSRSFSPSRKRKDSPKGQQDKNISELKSEITKQLVELQEGRISDPDKLAELAVKLQSVSEAKMKGQGMVNLESEIQQHVASSHIDTDTPDVIIVKQDRYVQNDSENRSDSNRHRIDKKSDGHAENKQGSGRGKKLPVRKKNVSQRRDELGKNRGKEPSIRNKITSNRNKPASGRKSYSPERNRFSPIRKQSGLDRDRHSHSPGGRRGNVDRNRYTPDRKRSSLDRDRHSSGGARGNVDRNRYTPDRKQDGTDRKQDSPNRKRDHPHRKQSGSDRNRITTDRNRRSVERSKDKQDELYDPFYTLSKKARLDSPVRQPGQSSQKGHQEFNYTSYLQASQVQNISVVGQQAYSTDQQPLTTPQYVADRAQQNYMSPIDTSNVPPLTAISGQQSYINTAESTAIPLLDQQNYFPQTSSTMSQPFTATGQNDYYNTSSQSSFLQQIPAQGQPNFMNPAGTTMMSSQTADSKPQDFMNFGGQSTFPAHQRTVQDGAVFGIQRDIPQQITSLTHQNYIRNFDHLQEVAPLGGQTFRTDEVQSDSSFMYRDPDKPLVFSTQSHPITSVQTLSVASSGHTTWPTPQPISSDKSQINTTDPEVLKAQLINSLRQFQEGVLCDDSNILTRLAQQLLNVQRQEEIQQCGTTSQQAEDSTGPQIYHYSQGNMITENTPYFSEATQQTSSDSKVDHSTIRENLLLRLQTAGITSGTINSLVKGLKTVQEEERKEKDVSQPRQQSYTRDNDKSNTDSFRRSHEKGLKQQIKIKLEIDKVKVQEQMRQKIQEIKKSQLALKMARKKAAAAKRFTPMAYCQPLGSQPRSILKKVKTEEQQVETTQSQWGTSSTLYNPLQSTTSTHLGQNNQPYGNFLSSITQRDSASEFKVPLPHLRTKSEPQRSMSKSAFGRGRVGQGFPSKHGGARIPFVYGSGTPTRKPSYATGLVDYPASP